MFDYLIVVGFAGSVLAERLASQSGKKILIIDTRAHGGNAYDHYDAAGIRTSTVPHLSTPRIRIPLTSRNGGLRAPRPGSVDGQLLPIPINLDTVNHLYGLSLTSFQVEEFFASVAEPKYIRIRGCGCEQGRSGTVRSSSVTTHASNGASTRLNSTSQLPPAFPPARTVMGISQNTYQAMPLYGYGCFEDVVTLRSKSCLTDYREIEDDPVPGDDLQVCG